MGTQPPLPRPPDDAERLRQLREEARARVAREESDARRGVDQRPEPRTIYGGPPVPSPITRRWTLRGLVLLIVGALAAIAAVIWGYQKVAVPVYGGPPVPNPEPQPPAAKDTPEPQPSPEPKPPVPVYGAPPQH